MEYFETKPGTEITERMYFCVSKIWKYNTVIYRLTHSLLVNYQDLPARVH